MKPKILIFIDWFLPGYKAGGPIQSIANIVQHLKGELDISIVTSNTDLGETEGYTDIETNQWIVKEGYRVMYLDITNQNLSRYRILVQEENYQFIYLNSLFSVNFSLLPIIAAKKTNSKVILAPRGMLGAGALAIKKRKKQVFLKLFKLTGFFKKVIWHATADSEAKEIKLHFGANSKIKIAPNLSANMGDSPIAKDKKVNEVRLFFLSRIAEKKNLLAALSYLKEVSQDYHINFDIFGPVDEAEYWQKCQQLIKELPDHIKVNYKGAIPNLQLKDHLKPQHFLLLPTRHENFGHVIMEAWQNACPVIISDQTPWQNLKSQKTGWEIPLKNKEQFIKAIETAAPMDQEAYNKWSTASWQFAKKFTSNPEVLEATRRLFL